MNRTFYTPRRTLCGDSVALGVSRQRLSARMYNGSRLPILLFQPHRTPQQGRPARFRVGLEPAGQQGSVQTAEMLMRTTTSGSDGSSPKAQGSSGRPPSNRRAPLILVVDDQQHVREILRVILEDIWGCRVIMAETSEQALQLAQKLRPDV